MKKILIILGTRPEAIKLAPVIKKLKKNNYEVIVCNTEQQKELSNQTLSFFKIKPNYKLDIMTNNQSLVLTQSLMLKKLNDIYSNEKIDGTIIQGDTLTAFTGALVSFYNKTPIFHVEAGLRSYNLKEPFPEEATRLMISNIVDLHFCPTNKDKLALLKEGINCEKIHVTGNSIIDALNCISKEELKKANDNLINQGIHLDEKNILITVHRRENHGYRLSQIIESIKYLSIIFNEHQFLIPSHPNPNVKQFILSHLSNIENVKILQPLKYPELISIMKKSCLILTDSGGIQEEAPTFGCPVLVLRYNSERTESIDNGLAKLVGADKDKIIKEASKILKQENAASNLKLNPYGDGLTSDKILEKINTFFNGK